MMLNDCYVGDMVQRRVDGWLGRRRSHQLLGSRGPRLSSTGSPFFVTVVSSTKHRRDWGNKAVASRHRDLIGQKAVQKLGHLKGCGIIFVHIVL